MVVLNLNTEQLTAYSLFKESYQCIYIKTYSKCTFKYTLLVLYQLPINFAAN